MNPDERGFLREFFRAVSDRPLEPDDEFYVPLYEQPGVDEDPIKLLARGIELSFSNTSAHLVSGYRGSGKSTELRRLRQQLSEMGFTVVLVDLDHYLNPTAPIDITDFLLVVAGAFSESEAVTSAPDVTAALGGSIWDRVIDFFRRSHIEVAGIDLTAKAGVDPLNAGLTLKGNLKIDPTFQRRVQQALAGHLGPLADEIGNYISSLAGALRDADDSAGVVLIVDSVEHLRDVAVTGDDVQRSLQAVFARHADRLHLPDLHTVYTVPPYLRVLERAALSSQYTGAISNLTAVTVESRHTREPVLSGIEALRTIVDRRHHDRSRLLSDDEVTRLVLSSGGHLRDLLYLVRETITRVEDLPATSDVVDRAIRQLSEDFQLVSEQDRRWLRAIMDTGEPPLDDDGDYQRLARFLDTHLVLAYRNGEEWYDVHPLARASVGPPSVGS